MFLLTSIGFNIEITICDDLKSDCKINKISAIPSSFLILQVLSNIY